MPSPLPLTLDALLRNGYFPNEIAPPFKTEDLADCVPDLPELDAVDPKFSKPLLYSIPKSWPARRVLSIPNPLHQILLSRTIASRWPELRVLISKSTLSLSTPTVFPDGHRAVSRKCDFDQWSIERLLRSADCRFVLRADLSRFYHTIYTHSLPWAIHTKAIAKSDRSPKLFGNELDFRVRNTQDQQTVGLPVGPDTSFILAEVLGSVIDQSLIEEMPHLQGIRYVDDFTLYFETRAEAESAYAILSRIVKTYELEVNERKTEIFEGPDTGEPLWKTALKSQSIRGRGEAQRASLISFISRCFELAQRFPGEGIIGYSIKKAEGSNIENDNFDLYQSFLISAMVHDSSVLPVIIKILFERKDTWKLVDVDSLMRAVCRMCVLHSGLRHNFEVSWLLWLLRALRIPVAGMVTSTISKSEDPLVALIALDLRDCGLISDLETTRWESLMKAENLYTEHWLLAYEALKRGWLRSDEGDYISSDGFFSKLRDHDVNFYCPPEDSGIEFVFFLRGY